MFEAKLLGGGTIETHDVKHGVHQKCRAECESVSHGESMAQCAWIHKIVGCQSHNNHYDCNMGVQSDWENGCRITLNKHLDAPV